jgi:hypothetical protein
LGHPSGHHLKKAMVEVVVEGHIQHQGVLGVKGSGFFSTGGGGMAKGQPPAGLQPNHQFPAAGMVGPKAAHMQQLQPGPLNGHGAGVTKERGRQTTHRHAKPLTHLSN